MTRKKNFWAWNRQLLPVKFLLFSMQGGIQSVLPYVTVHMYNLGLSIMDITVINALLPACSIFGPPLLGMCADRTGKIKIVTSITLFMTILSFSGLLLIPPLRKDKSYTVLEECEVNSHNNTEIYEKCPEFTYPFKNTTKKYIANCDVCSNSSTMSCSSPNLNFLEFNLSFVTIEANNCVYQVLGETCNAVSCPELLCDKHCKLSVSSHNVSLGNWQLTFTSFLSLRTSAQFFMSSSFPLIDAVVIEAFRKHKGKYGRHRIWPTFAIIIFPFFSGFLMDLATINGGISFWPACVSLGVLLFICMLLLIFISINQTKMSGTVLKNVRQLMNRNTLPLFTTSFLYGIVPGFLTVFLPIFIKKLKGPMYLIGLMATTTGIISLILLFFSDLLVKKFGYSTILSAGFFIGAVRLCALSMIWNPWLAIGIEFLKSFAQYLPFVALIIHGKSIAPSGQLSTVNGVIRALVYGCGRTVGVLCGGLLITLVKERRTFQIFAGLQVIFAFICWFMFRYTTKRNNLCTQDEKQSPCRETPDAAEEQNTADLLSSS